MVYYSNNNNNNQTKLFSYFIAILNNERNVYVPNSSQISLLYLNNIFAWILETHASINLLFIITNIWTIYWKTSFLFFNRNSTKPATYFWMQTDPIVISAWNGFQLKKKKWKLKRLTNSLLKAILLNNTITSLNDVMWLY